jgi:hypothetical protein
VLWEQPVERACYGLQRAAQHRFPGLLGNRRCPRHQCRVRRHHSLQNGLLISYSASTRVSPISRSIRSSNRASSSRPFLRRLHSRNAARTPLRKPPSRRGEACHRVSCGIQSGQEDVAGDNSAFVLSFRARTIPGSIKRLCNPLCVKDGKHRVYSLCGCLNDLRLACCFSIRLLRSLSVLSDMILMLSVRRY